jgi:hypothetical protein
MKKKWIPFLFSAFFLSGCALNAASTSGASNGSTSNTGGSSTGTPSTSYGGSSVSESDPLSYDDFWAYGTATSISLTFTNAALYALSDYGANYDQKYADVYFPATFVAKVGEKTYTYEEVGVRMKGNNSRTTICTSSGTINDVCHFKVSFKATFDDDLYALSQFTAFKHDWSNDAAGRKSRKNRTFAQMEKIDLKYLPRNAPMNSSTMKTYSQDIYCYDVFAKMGVVAPKAKWANLTCSDKSSSKTSSYEVVEAMDEVFVNHHFAEADRGGDLYKCSTYTGSSQGSYIKADLSLSGAVTTSKDSSGKANGTRIAKGKIGVENDYSNYHPNYQLKTNDNGENSDFSKMVNFINTVYSVRNGKASQSDLEAVLDVPEFLLMEGVSYCLGNFDNQRNNYNNYFIYFRSSDGKAVYIPYDWDWSLGEAMSSGVAVTSWEPYHTKTAHDSSNTDALYWCTILSNSTLTYSESSYRSSYASTIKSVVSKGYLTYSTYTAFVGSLSNAKSGELSDVKSYMSTKSSVIASSL